MHCRGGRKRLVKSFKSSHSSRVIQVKSFKSKHSSQVIQVISLVTTWVDLPMICKLLWLDFDSTLSVSCLTWLSNFLNWQWLHLIFCFHDLRLDLTGLSHFLPPLNGLISLHWDFTYGILLTSLVGVGFRLAVTLLHLVISGCMVLGLNSFYSYHLSPLISFCGWTFSGNYSIHFQQSFS